MAITVTDSAAKHVANFLAKRGKGIGLLLMKRLIEAAIAQRYGAP